LFVRRMAAWVVPSTKMADGILKEKKAFKKLLQQGYDIERDGTRNLVKTKLGSEDVQVSLRRYSSDLAVFHQIVVQKEYDPVITFIKQNGGENSIRRIVDAGANIGLTTVHLKKVFGAAEIVAIEPDAKNYAMLVRNIQLNGLDHVTPIQAAVWHKNEQLFLSSDFRDGKEWSISVNSKKQNENSGSVRGLEIVEIMKMQGFEAIDLLKIDIEGAERFLFTDKKTAGAFLSVTRFLAMEIHNEYNIRETIEGILQASGFEYFFAGELIIGKNTLLNK